MAARDRRTKAKVQRPARSQQDSNVVTNGVRRKIDLAMVNSDKEAVADVLEKVILKVEEVRGRPGRPRKITRSPRDAVKGGKRNQRERRLSVVRARPKCTETGLTLIDIEEVNE